MWIGISLYKLFVIHVQIHSMNTEQFMGVNPGETGGHVPFMFFDERDTISNVPLTNWSKLHFFSVENSHAYVFLRPFLTILSIKMTTFLAIYKTIHNITLFHFCFRRT